MKSSICMRDCYDTCAMQSKIKNGRLIVRANPNNLITGDFLCPKGAMLPKWFHSKDRLKIPLLRNSPKPSREFRKITWDKGIEIIAKRLKETIRKYGEKSVLLYYYYGDRGYVNANFPHRLFNQLNASVVEDVICDRNGEEALKELYGEAQGMDPEGIKAEKLIIYWGINAAWTNMHGFYFSKKSSAEIWTVDVQRSKTAELADRSIIIHPESDALLALGLAKVIVEKNLHDKKFLRENTVGFEKFRQVLSSLDLKDISKVTGLGEETIEELGEEYGKKKGVIHIGYGFQRTVNGGEAVRAISLLPALVGKLRGFIYSNKILPRNYARGAWLRKRDGYKITQIELGELIEEEKIKFVYVYGTNPLATLPNQKRLRNAILSTNVFISLHDIFMTDTALYSDIVLPSNTFFEREDIADSYYHRYLGLNEKIYELYGKSNSEVARMLANVLRIDEPCLYESDETVIKNVLEKIEISYEELKKEKVIKIPKHDLKPKTKSGKIEFPDKFSDLRPPNGIGLKLISATYLFTISSQYHNTYGHVDVKIHIGIKEAERRRIKTGDKVRVFNEFGEVETIVEVNNNIPDGLALMYKAFWPSLLGWNVNFLTPDKRSKKYRGTTLHTVWIEIERLD